MTTASGCPHPEKCEAEGCHVKCSLDRVVRLARHEFLSGGFEVMGDCVCGNVREAKIHFDAPTAERALLQARIARHLADEGTNVGSDFTRAGVLAFEALQRDEPETPVSMPTGQLIRAREVVEILGLAPLLLGR